MGNVGPDVFAFEVGLLFVILLFTGGIIEGVVIVLAPATIQGVVLILSLVIPTVLDCELVGVLG